MTDSTRRRQRGFAAWRACGFILLPVVLALTLVAAVAFLLTRAGGMNMNLAASAFQADTARYAAEAGLAQLAAHTQSLNCTGYTDLVATPFGTASISATVNPKAGSPVTLVSTATLADGSKSTLTRSNMALHQTTPYPLTLQPGAAGTDAWLYGNSAKHTMNYGVDTVLYLDSGASTTSRPLIKFDLSSIPSGSVIDAATLSLYQNSGSVSTLPNNPVINVHRVLRNWVEGTKFGSGTADGATWMSADGVTAWTSPGGDFDPTAAASAPASGSAVLNTWDVAALVDGWVNGAYPNYGMLLNGVGAISAIKFNSSDGVTAATRPKLDLTFLPPCGWVPAATGVTLQASQDTWIDEAHLGSNYAGSIAFAVSNAMKRERGLVQFDLSSIPSSKVLKSATLRLFSGSFSPKANSTLSVNRVFDSWTEAGALWKKRDGINAWSAGFGGSFAAASATANISSTFTAGWVEWDITALAQQWINGGLPNYGAGVLINTSSEIIFNSRESTVNQPQLVLTY